LKNGTTGCVDANSLNFEEKNPTNIYKIMVGYDYTEMMDIV